MDTETIVTAVLTLLGAAYVLSQLTGDSRDGLFVKTIEGIVKFIWRRP